MLYLCVMNSKATPDFWKEYEKLPDPIKDLAKKSYSLFKDNPAHPGLQFKKVNDEPQVYSVRVSLYYRSLGVKDGDTVIWFWIGDHDSYNKMIKSF